MLDHIILSGFEVLSIHLTTLGFLYSIEGVQINSYNEKCTVKNAVHFSLYEYSLLQIF